MTEYLEFERELLPRIVVEQMRSGDARPLRPWQENPTILDRIRTFLATASAKDEYVHGVDISKWQGSWDVQKTIDAGAQYAFIKATQNKFTDSKFDEYVEAAYAKNFPIGCYHFADPAGYSALDQAKYFASVVKGVGQLSVVLDMEWTGGLDRIQLNSWAHMFMRELDVQLGDRLKEIYTRVSWWDPHVSPAPWVKDYGLWVARWASHLEGPWSDGRFVPRDWDDWTNWQYSADGNGLGSKYGVESNSIDLNYFHGNWDNFIAHYTGEVPVEDHIHQDILDRLTVLESKVVSLNSRASQSELDIENLWTATIVQDEKIKALEDCCDPGQVDPIGETLDVRVKTGQRAVVFKLIGYDKACEEEDAPNNDPPGKPLALPPETNRVVYKEGTTFKIKAKAAISCKDNKDNHVINSASFKFGIVADGYDGAGSFVRLDKIDII
jgi:lysozyme